MNKAPVLQSSPFLSKLTNLPFAALLISTLWVTPSFAETREVASVECHPLQSQKREVYKLTDGWVVLPYDRKEQSYDFVFYTTPALNTYDVKVYLNCRLVWENVAELNFDSRYFFNREAGYLIDQYVKDEDRPKARAKAQVVYDLLLRRIKYREFIALQEWLEITFSNESDSNIRIKVAGKSQWILEAKEWGYSPFRSNPNGFVVMYVISHSSFFDNLDELFQANNIPLLSLSTKEEILETLEIRAKRYRSNEESPQLIADKIAKATKDIAEIKDLNWYELFRKRYSYSVWEWSYQWDISEPEVIDALIAQINNIWILWQVISDYKDGIDIISLISRSEGELSENTKFAIINSQNQYLIRNKSKRSTLTAIWGIVVNWGEKYIEHMLSRSAELNNDNWNKLVLNTPWSKNDTMLYGMLLSKWLVKGKHSTKNW